MREILFRGQRVDNGEWVYGFYVECLDLKNENAIPPFEKKKYIFTSWEESLLSNEDNGGVFEVKPESIGQYTGLLDKNGNKIFEGDRVKLGDSVVFIVEFINGAFVFKNSDTYIIPLILPKKEEIEIIGNIHENGDK